MYLLILGAIVFVLSQIKREGFSKPNGCSLLIYIVVGGLGISFFIAMCEGGSGEKNTPTFQLAPPNEAQIEKHRAKIKRHELEDEVRNALPPVTFTLSSEANTSGMVRIVLKTNLPDDTLVMVTLKNSNSEYTAQDEIAVSGGTCKTAFFGDDGSALSAGTYQAQITVPVAQVQPEDVRVVIGKQGENLTGPYVEKGIDSNIVRFSQDIQIPATAQTSSGERKAQTIAEWKSLITTNAKESAIENILGKPNESKMSDNGISLDTWNGAVVDGTNDSIALVLGVVTVQNVLVVVTSYNSSTLQFEPFPWYDTAINAAANGTPQQ